MSAIDWLSDSLSRPPGPGPETGPGDIADTALPESVTVSPLDAVRPDAVGLLPGGTTGLPRDLWVHSTSIDLARRLRIDPVAMMPALRELQYTLLLAELDPPEDAGDDARFLIARLDTLLDMGALEQAQALVEKSGAARPEVFRRAFDISLLTGREAWACRLLRRTPALSPTFPARIFCLAREGDWNAAALTLETGRALGYISDSEDALLARFLDPALHEGEPPLPQPLRPSPLEFRLFEAIGEPLPTATLPRAFAHADLRPNIGWKAQLEAGERLAAMGAIEPNRLLGLMTERKPAASGGIWDRVSAFQDFDTALGSGDPARVASTLAPAWEATEAAELEVVFAQLFAPELMRVPLSGEPALLAWKIGLLSSDYELIADAPPMRTIESAFLAGIAKGDVEGLVPPNEMAEAVAAGFLMNEPPVRLRAFLDEGRIGEAILRAISLITGGSTGDLDEVSDGIAMLRLVGLEDTARRTALELLILERRG